MHRMKFGLGRSLIKNRLSSLLKSQKEFNAPDKFQLKDLHSSAAPADFSSNSMGKHTTVDAHTSASSLGLKSYSVSMITGNAKRMKKGVSSLEGTHSLLRRRQTRECTVSLLTPHQLNKYCGGIHVHPCFVRSLASSSASQPRQNPQEHRKDISTVDAPFDAPTYDIPKPVTFTEGASYSLVILAGLGIAGAAGYAVFKELIFQPKEYKIFGKALERVQNDHQVRARIGSPITGYGQETRNRAARQRIPNRIWTDEDGVEHVEVNFYIRGPHGAGKVYSEMFKDKVDKQWKYTFLIVEITSPSPKQLMLESYVPA